MLTKLKYSSTHHLQFPVGKMSPPLALAAIVELTMVKFGIGRIIECACRLDGWGKTDYKQILRSPKLLHNGKYHPLRIQHTTAIFMFSSDLSHNPTDLIDNPSRINFRLTGKILLLENEEGLRDTQALTLKEQGYEVVISPDGRSVIPTIQNTLIQDELPFNLLILDAINGLDLCRMLRHQGNQIPIMIIGDKESANNCAFYLEAGADDYLTKPFGMREFLARCGALMRRQRLAQLPQPIVLQYQDIVLYSEECRVLVSGKEIKMSPKQFRLLQLFMSSPRRVWSREQLLEQVWGHDFIGDSKTVDVHIRWLREKLELDPSHPKYIITVRGFGYRFG